jgi:hypothetical protein
MVPTFRKKARRNYEMIKKSWIRISLMLGILFSILGNVPGSVAADPGVIYLPIIFKPSNTLCRFGVALPGSVTSAQIKQLRVGAAVNWGTNRPSVLDPDVTFLYVIRTGIYFNANGTDTAADSAARAQLRPGSFWQVGNEPDTCYEDQDCATPEVYAQQFYQIAQAVRSADPTAKLGFGTIVQPTPIRLAYLNRAWAELVRLAGGQTQASALVNFWTIHGFVLNEKPGEWGTGIPAGMNATDAPLFVVGYNEMWKTHDISLFQQRVRDFRNWMNGKGERNKALWITEYGSLLPPIDPPGINYVNVSDADTTNFMLQGFDFLLSATDASTGMPADGNRLVQRWFWYSLNDQRYNFGGSLFDPDNNNTITSVGQAFVNYTAALPADATCQP